jgi:transposase-like protein
MLRFSICELLDERRGYEYLLKVRHPEGRQCPRGPRLPEGQQPHGRHREPVVDYRCRECGAVFNLFTGTVWSGSRYTCGQIVLILRGVAQGVPTQHLAEELGSDRSQLLERRPEMQALIEQRLSPLSPLRHCDGSR